MANYNLVVDSTFRPFTYKELSEPLIQATQLHRDVEEKYGDLDLQSAIWEGLLDQEKEKTAYSMYKSYNDKLTSARDALNRYGLTPQTTATLQKIRGDYGRQIKPLETAYARREEQAKEQRTALSKDQSLIYQRMASETPLDEYLANPGLDYGQSYSGQVLAQQAASAYGQLARAAQDGDDQLKLELNRLTGVDYAVLERHGYSVDAIRKAMQDPQSAPEIFGMIADNLLNATGVSQWANENQLNQFGDWIKYGMAWAIGEPKYQHMTDSASLAQLQSDLSFNNWVRQRQWNIDNGYGPNGQILNTGAPTIDLKEYNKKYRAELTPYQDELIKKAKSDYSEYFDVKGVDGNGNKTYTLNGKGLSAYRNNSKGFKDFVDLLGGQEYLQPGANEGEWTKVQPGNVGNLWGRVMNDSYNDLISAQYLAIDVGQDSTQQDNIKTSLSNALHGAKLEEVKLKDVSKGYEKVRNGGEKTDDILNRKVKDGSGYYTINEIRESSRGIILAVEKHESSGKGKGITYYRVPLNVSTQQMNYMYGVIAESDKLREKIAKEEKAMRNTDDPIERIRHQSKIDGYKEEIIKNDQALIKTTGQLFSVDTGYSQKVDVNEHRMVRQEGTGSEEGEEEQWQDIRNQ